VSASRPLTFACLVSRKLTYSNARRRLRGKGVKGVIGKGVRAS
jgi:hypothetical protein